MANLGQSSWGQSFLGRLLNRSLTWLSSQAQQALQQKHSARLTRLSLGCIGFGMILMASQYWANRSLWYDEASLAINLVNRSYTELLERLRYSQAAPPLFLWLSKLGSQVAGNDERVLRFLPFVAGLGSLFLMYRLARKYSGGLTMLLALALFCTSPYGTYFAAEFKPYRIDLAVGLGFFQLLIAQHQKFLTRWQNLLLGGLGAILIWLSYPIIFIMAATELTGLWQGAQKGIKYQFQWLIHRLPMYVLWLSSFAGLYGLSIRQALSNDKLVESWSARYPSSFLDLVWGLDALSRFFYRPMGFAEVLGVLATIAFVLGCVSFYRRDRQSFWILNTPLLLTLLASYLHQYPFRDRLVLFLSPYAFLMISEGIIWLLAQQKRRIWATFLGLGLGASLLLPTVADASLKLVQPERFLKHHIRPIVAEMQQDWQTGDRLYVYSHAVRQFQYYRLQFGFFPDKHKLGGEGIPKQVNPDDPTPYVPAELEDFLQGRTWILLSTRDADVGDRLLEALDQRGQRLKVMRQPSALGALYQFRD